MRRLYLIAALLAIGGLLLPLAAYVIGTRLIGPYAGPRGFASYIGAIYADAAAGHPLALVLLLAPVFCFAVWALRGWWWRRQCTASEAD